MGKPGFARFPICRTDAVPFSVSLSNNSSDLVKSSAIFGSKSPWFGQGLWGCRCMQRLWKYARRSLCRGSKFSNQVPGFAGECCDASRIVFSTTLKFSSLQGS